MRLLKGVMVMLRLARVDYFCSSTEEEINSLNSAEGWTEVESVMDSGSAECVAHKDMFPDYPIEESPGSKRGQHFTSGNLGTCPCALRILLNPNPSPTPPQSNLPPNSMN
jgi:hypothetical protein